jgi:hypothetical protein
MQPDRRETATEPLHDASTGALLREPVTRATRPLHGFHLGVFCSLAAAACSGDPAPAELAPSVAAPPARAPSPAPSAAASPAARAVTNPSRPALAPASAVATVPAPPPRGPLVRLTNDEAARHRLELERLLARKMTRVRSSVAPGASGMQLGGFDTVVVAHQAGAVVETRCVQSVDDGMEFLIPSAPNAPLPTE